MGDILTDIKYGLRGLFAHRAFTLAAVLTLALGVGITTAIFTAVRAVVLRPLAFPHSERLVTICEDYPGATADWCSVSPPNIEDVAARARSLEAIGIGRTWGYSLTTPDGQRSVLGGIVTPGALRALGARAVIGRLFEPSDLIGRPSVVTVLSYESWQTRFGGDPSILGKTLVLDTLPVTVVGVMAPEFELPKMPKVDLWRPIHLMPNDPEARSWRGFVAYGLLREGATIDQTRSEVSAIGQDLRRQYFATTERWSLTPRSLQDLVVSGVRPTMYAMFGAAIALLLIGCLNVANLLLVRANARGREMAVRAALGATRGRLARVLIVESTLLGVGGSLGGLLLGAMFTKLFTALAPPGIPRIETVHVDAAVLMFGLLAGAVATLVFGLPPAVRAARGNLSDALREGGRLSSQRGSGLRSSLVVVELALAVVLVTAAGLLVRTFAAYSAWDSGFDRGHLLVFSVSAPTKTYPTRAKMVELWTRVEDELAALPGVQSVATGSSGPLFGGDGASAIALENGRTPPGANAVWSDVSPGWFKTLGVPIVRGRDLDRREGPDAPLVTLVNEAFAAKYWPGENAVGKRFTVTEPRIQLEIVGIVRTVPSLDPGAAPDLGVYWSNRQLTRPFTYVLVRTSGSPSAIAGTVRARLSSIDHDLEPGTMRPYTEIIERRLARPKFTMLLLGTFGLSALLLGAVGVYGLLSYIVSMRSREIAIRLALGAQRGQVLASVIGWGARLTAIGGAIGIGAALLMGRALSTIVVGVSAHDPITFIGSAVVLLLVALGACALPSRRASRVDPAVALTAE